MSSVKRENKHQTLPRIASCQPNNELKEFGKFCSSVVGPRGSLKLIVAEAGTIMVTSSSERLWNFIRLEHPLVELILNYHNKNVLRDYASSSCFLTAGILCSIQEDQSVKFDLTEIEGIMDDVSVPIDVGNIDHLMTLVATVMSSKPGTGLLSSEVASLSKGIVEAWLLTVRNNGELGEVSVRVEEGGAALEKTNVGSSAHGEWRIHTGMICKFAEEDVEHFRNIKAPLKVALYDMMLDQEQNSEAWQGAQLEYRPFCNGSLTETRANHLINQLKKAGVNLLCCRKVIGDDLSWIIRKSGIMVLERLGTLQFNRLVRISGGTAKSSLQSQLTATQLGSISEAEIINALGNTYLRLDQTGSGQIQLLTSSLGEEQAAELKILIEKAIDVLNLLVTKANPKAFPGGGCLESSLASHLLMKSKEETRENSKSSDSRQILINQLFEASLIYTKWDKTQVVIDMDYGHLWQSSEEKACSCGLVSIKDLFQEQILLLELNSRWEHHRLANIMGQHRHQLKQLANNFAARSSTRSTSRLLMDSYQHKKLALLHALDIAQQLSNLGAVLICP